MSDAERARAYRERKRQQALPVSRSAGSQALLARVRARAESSGVSVHEVVERLLSAYAEGKLNVPPRSEPPEAKSEPLTIEKVELPASTPSPPPPESEEEIPPDPLRFQSELMRRMRGQS